MFYTIYKVTNKINGKVYIGCHKTENLDDNYMGSGKILKRAIQKYGIENFQKEILEVFDNPEDMFKMEARLVTESFVKDSNNYNLKKGGEGGFDYINQNDLNSGKIYQASNITYEHRLQSLSTRREKLRKDKDYRQKHLAIRRKIAKSNPNFYRHMQGKKHTEETKAKIGEANKQMTGQKNSQYGTMWITDGLVSKKILKDNEIPDGWVPGRIIKKK